MVVLIFELYKIFRHGKATLIRAKAGKMADNAARNSCSTKAQLYSWDPKQEKYKTCKPARVITRASIKNFGQD